MTIAVDVSLHAYVAHVDVTVSVTWRQLLVLIPSKCRPTKDQGDHPDEEGGVWVYGTFSGTLHVGAEVLTNQYADVDHGFIVRLDAAGEVTLPRRRPLG